MPSLKTKGSNPYTLQFVPKKGTTQAVKNWEIKKAKDSTCLSLAVTPVAGTEKEIQLIEQPGNKFVKKKIPQQIQVALDCGKCTGGKAFTVIVTARYGRAERQHAKSVLKTVSKPLTIYCASPDSSDIIEIAFVTDQVFLDGKDFAMLTPEAIACFDILERSLVQRKDNGES